MKFLYQNVIFLTRFLIIMAHCICPTVDTYNNPANIYINTSYSQEWWYFLHNILDDTSPIISIENSWIRQSPKCNNISLYIYQESILWKNGSFTHKLEYKTQQDIPKSLYWEINNQYLSYKTDEMYIINIDSDSAIIKMKGYGYPQGRLKNSFVKTGSKKCDTSYTLSFLNLDTTINNFKAISYGEHVYTTQGKDSSPYTGWNCHYIHNLYSNLNFTAYFLCESKFPNSSRRDPYRRSLILWNDNSTTWTTNFTVEKLQNWTNKKTNTTYPISWKINLIEDSTHYLVAINKKQEVVSIDNFNFWDGSALMFDSKIGFIGFGFNEILET